MFRVTASELNDHKSKALFDKTFERDFEHFWEVLEAIRNAAEEHRLQEIEDCHAAKIYDPDIQVYHHPAGIMSTVYGEGLTTVFSYTQV